MKLFRNTAAHRDSDGTLYSYLAPVDDAPLSLEDTDEERRQVFFFPGYLSVSGSKRMEQYLNVKCKAVENLLGGTEVLAKQPIDFYTLHYDQIMWQTAKKAADIAARITPKYPFSLIHDISRSTGELGRVLHTLRYKQNPEVYFSAEAKEFCEKILMPVMDRHYRNLSLPHEERIARIAHDFSRITFVTDSYGGIFAEEIANCMKKSVPRCFPHIKDFEIDDLLSFIVHISAPNVLNAEKPHPYSSVFMTGHGDACHHYMTRGRWSETLDMRQIRDGISNQEKLDALNTRQLKGVAVRQHSAGSAEITFDPSAVYVLNQTYYNAAGRLHELKSMKVINTTLHDTFVYTMPLGEDNRHVELMKLAMHQAVTRPLGRKPAGQDLLPEKEVKRIISEPPEHSAAAYIPTSARGAVTLENLKRENGR